MDAGPSCSPYEQITTGFDSNIRDQFDYPPGPVVSFFYCPNLVKSADRIDGSIDTGCLCWVAEIIPMFLC